MCLRVSYKKKIYKKIICFASLKSLKKGIGSRSVSQRYGSTDPDPHQNVMEPQHGLYVLSSRLISARKRCHSFVTRAVNLSFCQDSYIFCQKRFKSN